MAAGYCFVTFMVSTTVTRKPYTWLSKYLKAFLCVIWQANSGLHYLSYIHYSQCVYQPMVE
jgi:hypothetical protein